MKKPTSSVQGNRPWITQSAIDQDDNLAEATFLARVRGRLQQLTSENMATHGILLIHVLLIKSEFDSENSSCREVQTITVLDRLDTCLQDNGLYDHLGESVFGVFIDSVTDAEGVGSIARTLLTALRQPVTLESGTFHLDARIGIACYPQDSHDVGRLLVCAEQSLRRLAVLERCGYEFYDAEMGSDLFRQQEIISLLSSAAANKDFTVAYQPLIDAKTKRLIGAEALLRWTDQNGVPQRPSEFVPLLEQSGLISDVGFWVIEQACQQAQYWRSHGLPDFRISINLSRIQLLQNDLIKKLDAILKATNLPADAVELEITESIFLPRPERAISQLHSLIAMGTRPFIDDFGVGFSSIGLLKKLPAAGIKIDHTFICDIDRTEHDLVIVKTIIDLAGAFGLSIVAEGVETQEQADILTDLGVNTLQGFLFGAALPAADFESRFIDPAGRC